MPDVVVLKIGGDVLLDEAQRGGLGQNVKTLVDSGRQVVIVHGAGPQLSALQERLGIPINKVGGRRITDAPTLEVVKYIQAGQVNVDLVSTLTAAGVVALGFAGVSAGVVRAVKRPARVVSGCGEEPVDFGLVGDVASVNTGLIAQLLELGLVPVIASLGADTQGQPYNINADVVAGDVAAALHAESLVLATAIGGIFRDPEDPATRLDQLDEAAARQAIKDQIITGGMIPKVEESLKAMKAGVRSILIANVAEPGGLRRALDAPGALGTMLVGDR